MRRLAITAAIALAVLGALALRVVLEGRGALADGDALAAAGQPRAAIDAWARAARWYLPAAPHVDDAYARLTATATTSTEPATAAAAWRAIRGAALATRHLWEPHADDRARADAALARLAATTAPRPTEDTGAGATAPARTAWHAARLAAAPGPSRGAAALAVLGLVGLLAGVALLVGRGVDAAGVAQRRPALVGLAITLGGVAAWALGLYNA